MVYYDAKYMGILPIRCLRRLSDHLVPETQMVVSSHMGVEKLNPTPLEEQPTLTAEPSLQLINFSFSKYRKESQKWKIL